MLENQFINFRTMMQQLLDWIVEQIATYFGYPPISIKLQEFKMADDVQQKQLVMSLNQQQLVSNQSMLQQLCPELDYDQEQRRVTDEQLAKIKQQSDIQRSQSASGIIDPMATPPQPPQQGNGNGPKQADNPEQRPPRGPNAQI